MGPKSISSSVICPAFGAVILVHLELSSTWATSSHEYPGGHHRRPDEHAALQPAVPARELPDEVLHVPRAVLAPALLCGRRPEGSDCGVRPGQDGGGDGGRPTRTHHLARSQKVTQAIGFGSKIDGPDSEGHGGDIQRQIRLAARSEVKPGGTQPLQDCPQIRSE